MSEHTSVDKLRDCPVVTTVAVIGGKWKPRILWQLRSGSTRFGQLQRIIGASEKMLSQSLRALQQAGVISRTEVQAGKVLTTEYSYTQYGQTLVPVLEAMGHWGIGHTKRVRRTR